MSIDLPSSLCACSAVNETTITLPIPDDFHHHFRDGARTRTVMEHVIPRFRRCIAMPNLQPPVTTAQQALDYRKHILASIPSKSKTKNTTKKSDKGDDDGGITDDDECDFVPLMTIYLTDNTTPAEIRKAHATGHIPAAKYYPAGATTNSAQGVTDISNIHPALRAMEECGMVLCIHSEVSRIEVDIFDREGVFIQEVMVPLVNEFPKLKIVMEHISTEEAVEYVKASHHPFLKASITAHHILYNRNALLVGGIKPHFYCLPILKRETHRLALLAAATSGSPKFFAGTDSAPHTTGSKQSACGCAGIYTAHAAVELYAEAFDSVGRIEMLEDFVSRFGAEHYGLERNERRITLVKRSWDVPKSYRFGNETVTPLRAGESVAWSIVE